MLSEYDLRLLTEPNFTGEKFVQEKQIPLETFNKALDAYHSDCKQDLEMNQTDLSLIQEIIADESRESNMQVSSAGQKQIGQTD